jgi:ABC-type uncharacterized transport system permease subunit
MPARCSWADSSCLSASSRSRFSHCFSLLLALPFAAITQTPSDLFVERLQGSDVLVPLAQQVMWAAIMLGAAQVLTVIATRRVVIQGG